MGSTIVMIPVDPADVSAPPAGKETFFLDSTDNNRPKTKNEGGIVSDVGSSRYVKVPLAYTDFSDAGTTKIIDAIVLAGGQKLGDVIVVHNIAFSGGSITAYTIDVGITTAPSKWISLHDVFQAPGDNVFDHFHAADIESWGAPTDVEVLATSTGDNLNNATAGQVDIYFLIEDVKQ